MDTIFDNKIMHALRFIVFLGLVSLFADITYEGGRSITGQYLAELGATSTLVGFVAGFGEFLGYALRLFSGLIADKTGRYWTFILLGYGTNVFAIPLLAVSYSWPVAAILIIVERLGKGLRNPPRDALLSYAAKQTGRGWGFGLHSALDQFGAVLGPFLITLTYAWHGSYRISFGYLFIPALISLLFLLIAKNQYPEPQKLEVGIQHGSTGMKKRFWLYLGAMALVAAGYVDFALIAYHLQKTADFSLTWIPLFYALAMASEGLSALALGRLYDLFGERILIFSTLLALFFCPLVFFGGSYLVLFGMLLWGVGYGAQASIVRAIIANLISTDQRSSAYGIFNFVFGLSWFLGSFFMGFLYNHSLIALVLFSCLIQAAALPILIYLTRSHRFQ